MCGCGATAPIASSTNRRYGYVKGEPKRFIRGHGSRGITLSPERRAQISEALRGRTLSAESRAKVSAAKRGFRHTPETRAKMSAAWKGRIVPTGAAHPNWKGGRIMRNGRPQTYVGFDHPMANKAGYVFDHRLMAAEVMGRPLEPHEHVHHIDLDPLNNRPENLAVVSLSQHSSIHQRIRAGVDPGQAVSEVLG